MTLLQLDTFSVHRDGRAIFQNVSFKITPGEVVGLIGPNGAGKTTLMRASLGLIQAKGQSSLAELTRPERAKRVAWMPQERSVTWPIPVEAVVRLGRLPHGGVDAETPEDQAATEAALDLLELTTLRERPATELSGGETARVLLARAIAQETPLLMADEPIAGLDPAHQISVMETFRSLADQGRSVFVSIHDLGLAARHCDRLILLGAGGLVADGEPAAVLNAQKLESVFGIRAHVEFGAEGMIFQSLEVLR